MLRAQGEHTDMRRLRVKDSFTGQITLEIDLEEGEILYGMKGERQTHPE